MSLSLLDWGPLFPTTCATPQVWWQALGTWLLAFHRVCDLNETERERGREREREIFLSYLGSDVPSFLLYSIVHQINCVTCGRELYRMWRPWTERHLDPSYNPASPLHGTTKQWAQAVWPQVPGPFTTILRIIIEHVFVNVLSFSKRDFGGILDICECHSVRMACQRTPENVKEIRIFSKDNRHSISK